MRFGGPIFDEITEPEASVSALKESGYSAAYCPLSSADDDETTEAFAAAADQAGILMAEVGAWSNPLSADRKTRAAALAMCQERLALADKIGARCCVNIAGSRGDQWDGPHPDNLTPDTFDLIVETVRGIIDAVKPTRTFYTLETMPWMYPDSAENYLRLIHAIDRKRFAVHFDPVNLVNSPQRYYASGDLIRDFTHKLGPRIRSCHAKDIALSGRMTVHLDETRPGLGGLDYRTYLRELAGLDPDTPLMMEHLSTEKDYEEAAGYVRSIAKREGVAVL